MLDVTGTEESLGKSVGSDVRDEKTTFVSLKGLNECGKLVEKLTVEAQDALACFPDATFLSQLAGELIARTN